MVTVTLRSLRRFIDSLSFEIQSVISNFERMTILQFKFERITQIDNNMDLFKV